MPRLLSDSLPFGQAPLIPLSLTLFCPNTVTSTQPSPSAVSKDSQLKARRIIFYRLYSHHSENCSTRRRCLALANALPYNSGQVPQMWHTWLTACHWQGSLPSTLKAAMATSAGCEKATSDRLDVKNNMPYDTADDTFVIYQEQLPTSPYTQRYWHLRDNHGGYKNQGTS